MPIPNKRITYFLYLFEAFEQIKLLTCSIFRLVITMGGIKYNLFTPILLLVFV